MTRKKKASNLQTALCKYKNLSPFLKCNVLLNTLQVEFYVYKTSLTKSEVITGPDQSLL